MPLPPGDGVPKLKFSAWGLMEPIGLKFEVWTELVSSPEVPKPRVPLAIWVCPTGVPVRPAPSTVAVQLHAPGAVLV